MSSPDVQQPPEPHEAALLLPWFLGGTLAARERLLVEEHLSGCETCRSELAAASILRQRTREMWTQAPYPSPSLHARVMWHVRKQARATAPNESSEVNAAAAARPRPQPRLAPLAAFFKRLMQPTWAPTVAVAVIVLQAGALSLLLLGSQTSERTGVENGITPRSVAPSLATRVRIAFKPTAKEEQIRLALLALGGQIVDGPSADGVYEIQLPMNPPAVLAQKLRVLREQPGLVERIEHAQ
jgi:hypothetical protein